MSDRERDADAEVVVFPFGGTLARADIPALCERLHAVLVNHDQPIATVVCDVADVMRADAITVDALARLQLTAHRLGHRLLLRNAGADLRVLLALLGLDGVVPLELQRQVKEREQLCGIEEERDPADPAF